MHLVDHLDLPSGYRARPYAGPSDHPAMVRVLTAHRESSWQDELPTVEGMDVTYAHLDGCDTSTDIALVESAGEVIAYTRTSREDLDAGTRDLVVFTPIQPAHVAEPLFDAMVAANEEHLRPWAEGADARFRAYADHPGPGRPADRQSSWLERRGYTATEWGAALVRPDLDDVPERTLPDGAEVRPVTKDEIRPILEASFEAFRGEWDFREPTEDDFVGMIEDPDRDESLWKVAWAGDTVVGQVRSYIRHEENEARGYRRGYTENISTHRDWRNRGIAGTLLAMSLTELKSRGMSEASLGADTNNPGGAFQLYQSLGFQLRSYEAVYTKPVE